MPSEIIANHGSPGSGLETLSLLLNPVVKEAKILGCESLNFRHVAVLGQKGLCGR